MNVIVIEDNQDLNDMLVEDLRAAGHEAAGFNSVESFEASGLSADILLLDVNLPGKTGLEFAQEMRAVDKRIGLVVLSARTGADNRITGYQAGVDVYLQKPVGSQEMLAAIDRVAERVRLQGGRHAAKPPQFSLAVDCLTFSGPLGSVVLSQREVNVLAALANAPGDHVSYDTCKALYSPGEDVRDATLEVAIGRLRKKIATASGVRKSIVAVRGEGYRLIIDLVIG